MKNDSLLGIVILSIAFTAGLLVDNAINLVTQSKQHIPTSKEECPLNNICFTSNEGLLLPVDSGTYLNLIDGLNDVVVYPQFSIRRRVSDTPTPTHLLPSANSQQGGLWYELSFDFYDGDRASAALRDRLILRTPTKAFVRS